VVIARDRGFEAENTDDRPAEKEPKTASLRDLIRSHPMATAAVVIVAVLMVIAALMIPLAMMLRPIEREAR